MLNPNWIWFYLLGSIPTTCSVSLPCFSSLLFTSIYAWHWRIKTVSVTTLTFGAVTYLDTSLSRRIFCFLSPVVHRPQIIDVESPSLISFSFAELYGRHPCTVSHDLFPRYTQVGFDQPWSSRISRYAIWTSRSSPCSRFKYGRTVYEHVGKRANQELTELRWIRRGRRPEMVARCWRGFRSGTDSIVKSFYQKRWLEIWVFNSEWNAGAS